MILLSTLAKRGVSCVACRCALEVLPVRVAFFSWLLCVRWCVRESSWCTFGCFEPVLLVVAGLCRREMFLQAGAGSGAGRWRYGAASA